METKFARFVEIDGAGKFAYDGGSLLYQFKINSNGTLSPNPSASNSITAGSSNQLIMIEPGGR